MNIISSLLFLLISQAVLASEPNQLCQQNPGCTSEMKQILELYKIGNSEFIQADLSAFSGVCYHLDPDYDPQTAHHGAFVFEKVPEGSTAIGVFSFYAPENPYQNLSATQLKDYLSQSSKPALLEKTTDSIELNYKYPETQITYWFRSLAGSNQLIVIGHQAHLTSHRSLFCRMNRHSF